MNVIFIEIKTGLSFQESSRVSRGVGQERESGASACPRHPVSESRHIGGQDVAGGKSWKTFGAGLGRFLCRHLGPTQGGSS